MPEVIGAELKLKTIPGPFVGRYHDTGVIDEDVNPVKAGGIF